MSETLVFPAPAVASAGRVVVVARDKADRPVHAQTFSGAPLKGFRARNVCISAGDVNAGSILRRKLARGRVLSIKTMRAEDGTFSARVERDYVFNWRAPAHADGVVGRRRASRAFRERAGRDPCAARDVVFTALGVEHALSAGDLLVFAAGVRHAARPRSGCVFLLTVDHPPAVGDSLGIKS
jgi:hypothetical protein